MVGAFEGADVEAVEDYFAAEFVPVVFDVVVLDHDYDHVDVAEELVEVAELVFGNLVILKEGVVAFERTGEVAFLCLKELQRR